MIYSVHEVWASSFVCLHVLSTYDISHVINFTRLSLFLSIFCLHAWRKPGNEARAVLLAMNVDR